MKRLALAAIILIAVIIAGLFAARMFSNPPADLDLTREKASKNGYYQVQIRPEVEPVTKGALHGWLLVLHDRNGAPITDATIAVDGGMPQHGHGLPTQPSVGAPLGEGNYRVEGVRFNMGGWWQLKFTIDAAAGRDTVTFNISL